MPTPQLRLDHVTLAARVGSHVLLQDVSFDLFEGDRLAIVGPTGAGKTSLLRVMNRLSEVSQGKIFFENQDICHIPVLQLRRHITLVPQESKLLGMTVRQALEYPLHLRNLPRQTIQQRIMTYIEQLRIPEEWLERTEVQLSVGQRQWVAIARALIIQPKIVLLDEPTSALDAGRSNYLIHVLTEIAQTQHTTVVMVNHQLDVAEHFATRVLYLQQGKLLHDSLNDRVDWAELKQNLVDAETMAAEEWE